MTPDTPDTPATVDPPTEPLKVTGSQPMVNAAEPNQERGRSLRESRWANPDPDSNPIEDRRARVFPGTHREAEERGWLGGCVFRSSLYCCAGSLDQPSGW